MDIRAEVSNELLRLQDVTIDIKLKRKQYDVITDLSLQIEKGEVFGIVGESGCGKSVLSHSILGLQPDSMKVAKGEVFFDGQPLNYRKKDYIRKLRGKEISMIFQNPMSSLNPSLTIGQQVMEMFRLHFQSSKAEAKQQTIELLKKVGLSRAEELIYDYPHQLSGGMQQRIMIAIALAAKPKLLIADEPTTALDVTIQAQILELMRTVCREEGTAILLISHDMGVMAQMCDRIAVMYAGEIVEVGYTKELLTNPQHPYTKGLLQSIPTRDKKNERLYSVKGSVPALTERGKGCPFADRCEYAMDVCVAQKPDAFFVNKAHEVRCFLTSSEVKKLEHV